jgi:hypothetical protein
MPIDPRAEWSGEKSVKSEIRFDNMPEYVLLETRGEASVDGVKRMLKQLVESPQWKPGAGQLMDHRKLDVKKLTADDLRKIRDILMRHSSELGLGRCAFVVKDTLGFGLGRMYELLGGESIHGDFAVFYSLDEARRWLKG